MKIKFQHSYLLFLILIILGLVFYNNRIIIKEHLFPLKQVKLPPAVKFPKASSLNSDYNKITTTKKQTTTKTTTSSSQIKLLPIKKNNNLRHNISEINLAVPFTIQSPDQKWNEPYKEGCEEASVLMVQSFLKNKKITITSALQDIQAMVNWQKNNYHQHANLTASSTAEMIQKFYHLQTQIVNFQTIDDIKNILRNSYPIIIPTAGRKLKNPNFKQPGPLYHMLVIKGFLKNGSLITNDPGTRHGKDYIYKAQNLWSAIADWDENLQTPNPKHKIGIVVK